MEGERILEDNRMKISDVVIAFINGLSGSVDFADDRAHGGCCTSISAYLIICFFTSPIIKIIGNKQVLSSRLQTFLI
jgi:hypothetical protein